MDAMPVARAASLTIVALETCDTVSTKCKQLWSAYSEGQQLDLASVVSRRSQLQPEVLHLSMVLRKLRHWVHASPKLLVFVKEAVIIQHCTCSIGTSGADLCGGEGFSREPSL